MADFSSTPIEILETIFERLYQNPIDSFNFSRVSKEWRSMAVEKKRHILPRLMILPLQEDRNTHNLFTLSSSTSNWEVPLPEIREKYCLAFNKGWILVADESMNEIFLLDPLTKERIPLPFLPPCPEKQTLLQKGVFSLKFSSTSHYLVTITVSRLLLFYNAEVDKWTIRNLDCTCGNPDCTCVREVGYYKQQIFVIRSIYDGICHKFKVSSIYSYKVPEEMNKIIIDYKYEYEDEKEIVVGKTYFLETPQEELLMVYQYQETVKWKEMYTTVDYEVFKFNEKNKNWVKIEDLDDQVVFLGVNAVCVSAQHVPECSANSIYFLNFRKYSNGWDDMGVFNMKDGCIKPFFEDLHPLKRTPSVWFTPNLGDEKERV